MVSLRYYLGIFCCALALTARPQVSLIAENDIFAPANNDRGFTHGSYIGYELNGISYFLSQNIYTPEDISDPTPPANQRPYAGLLLIGGTKYNRIESVIVSRTFAMGVLGPNSMSEESQKTIHEWIGSQEPMGWDNQLPNEFVVQTRFEVGREFSPYKYLHLYPYVKTSLGSVVIDGGAGGRIYLGSGKQTVDERIVVENERGWYGNLFVGAEIKGVAFNATIEGNAFTETDLGVGKESAVAEGIAGLEFGKDYYSLGYSLVLRTNEYKDQPNTTHFGVVRIGF